MSRRAFTVLVSIIAAATVGCSVPPNLQAITAPPPTAQASLVDDDGNPSITITEGVALAFSCTDASTTDPCTGVAAVMADPSIASVLLGYVDGLSPASPSAGGAGIDGALPESTLVVTGLEPGNTTLALTSSSGDVSVQVTVVAF